MWRWSDYYVFVVIYEKLKVQNSYALELITYIVSGLINKYMILTFIYKIVLSSKESRIHNTIYLAITNDICTADSKFR